MTDFTDPDRTQATDASGSPSLGERITDIFAAPRRALIATVAQPAWWLPALISMLIVGVFTFVNVQQITVHQLEVQLETASGNKAQALEQQLDLFLDPPVWLRSLSGAGAAAGVLVGGLVFAMVCHLFLRLSEGRGRVGQTVGVVFWTGLIAYGLKTILSWVVLIATGSVAAMSLTVAAFLGGGDPQSAPMVAANFLGDPFVWWMLTLQISGQALAHQMELRRAATVIVATYVLLAVVMIAFSLVGSLLSGA